VIRGQVLVLSYTFASGCPESFRNWPLPKAWPISPPRERASSPDVASNPRVLVDSARWKQRRVQKPLNCCSASNFCGEVPCLRENSGPVFPMAKAGRERGAGSTSGARTSGLTGEMNRYPTRPPEASYLLNPRAFHRETPEEGPRSALVKGSHDELSNDNSARHQYLAVVRRTDPSRKQEDRVPFDFHKTPGACLPLS
jgi:hypothetical protein